MLPFQSVGMPPAARRPAAPFAAGSPRRYLHAVAADPPLPWPSARRAVARRGRAGAGWRLVACAAVAAAFTLAMVRFPPRHGRLSLFPTFDDVIYLADGARRLERYYDGGPRAVVGDFLDEPPHAPWSTYEAAAGFMLFGM